MANDLGLSLPFALNSLDQVLAHRRPEQIAAQQRAQALKQQQFENELKLRNESRLEDVMKGQQADRTAARQEQDFARAGAIAQAIPADTFLGAAEPGVKLLQQAGYGGVLRT